MNPVDPAPREEMPPVAAGGAEEIPDTAIVRFGDVARALLENGYYPIPLKPNSKVPAVKNWTEFEATDAAIEKYGDCGCGLRMGRNGVHAFDIDVTDKMALQPVLRHVVKVLQGNGRPIFRQGKPPKLAFLFRDPEGGAHPKLTGNWLSDAVGVRHRIEVLGDGQQLVAFGIHPDTEAPYRWLGGESPLTVRADELPILTREHVGW